MNQPFRLKSSVNINGYYCNLKNLFESRDWSDYVIKLISMDE